MDLDPPASTASKYTMTRHKNTEIWITYCSKKKIGKNGAWPPEKLYDSYRIQDFISSCRKEKLEWYILSAKHGLLGKKDKRAKYDFTLRVCSGNIYCLQNGKILSTKKASENFNKLVKGIRSKLKKKEVCLYYALEDLPDIGGYIHALVAAKIDFRLCEKLP